MCATELRYNASRESRINELSRCKQRDIKYSNEEGSQQAAGNEPKAIQISPSPSEPRCGLFQIGFLFQVGGFAGRSMPRGRYRRQREYPQPPPPNKSTSKITINRVSIVSPLFRLSILIFHSVRALFVPDLPMRGKGCVSASFLRLSAGNEETARYKRRISRPKGRIRAIMSN